MLIDYQNGQTGIIVRLKIRQNTSGSSPGQGMTGVTNSSSGLVIATVADVEATTTSYTASGSTIATISTLGTYAAPTSGQCNFKQVDATNHPGIYELQLSNARFAVSNAKSLLISITGVSGMADCDVVIPLRAVNPYDSQRFGVLALPSANAGASGGLPTVDAANGVKLSVGTGTGQVNVSAGIVPSNLQQWLGTAPASAPALASQIPANFTSATFASAGVFATAALANVPTTGLALGPAGLDAITVETGVNMRQAQSPILAAACGVLSGAGTGSIVVKGGNTTTTRIAATTDASGNRTAVTLTIPS